MNRRECLVGAAAVAVPLLPPMPDVGAEQIWTYVTVVQGEGPWAPGTMAGYVLHRRDLSDLGEPYLSAVRAAQTALGDRGAGVEITETW